MDNVLSNLSQGPAHVGGSNQDDTCSRISIFDELIPFMGYQVTLFIIELREPVVIQQLKTNPVSSQFVNFRGDIFQIMHYLQDHLEYMARFYYYN